MGPNGVGKTSTLRTLAGVWPSPSVPPGAFLIPHALFVVPQEPLFAFGKTLLEQVFYPSRVNSTLMSLLTSPSAVRATGELRRAKEALESTGFPLHQFPLHQVCDWDIVLSGGQKQRVSWARLFWHRPSYALLDEPTSGVSQVHIYSFHSSFLSSSNIHPPALFLTISFPRLLCYTSF